MPALAPLGIRRIEALHYYVQDLERSRRFYTQKLDFAEIGESGVELVEGGHQRAAVFEAGGCRVICSAPVGVGGRAYRYLQKHPDGIGSIVLEVDDAERAFELLEGRGGTPVNEVVTTENSEGRLKTFLITTAFGDTTFRFIERRGRGPLYPGFVRFDEPRGGHNAFGFADFDHVTANFETMAPAVLWLEHVLGFERFWHVEFHTDDVTRRVDEHGSGLRSIVMWDPSSGVKFANNEPYRPNFRASQINVFHAEHRGDGVQHVALAVAEVTAAVRGLRGRGVDFMPAPHAYYTALPERLRQCGIGSIKEPIPELEELGILVDGDGPGRYLLQIFLKDSANMHGSKDAGPFFYELIQRCGDQGFGAGNFRALFESIEREQASGSSI
jgi:4-hydroxyphenylpyruvate dioxygenase